MQDTTEYYALRDLRAPGSMVYGARAGDGVPAATVANWDLEVGVDVMPRDTSVIARPQEDAERAQWEAYAIGQGMPVDDARDASLSDLRAVPEPDAESEPEPVPDPNAPPERPAPDAKKAEWVAYAIATGADRAWAEAKDTTKADLQDFEPKRDHVPGPTETVVTDPVAVSASEAQADANEETAAR